MNILRKIRDYCMTILYYKEYYHGIIYKQSLQISKSA